MIEADVSLLGVPLAIATPPIAANQFRFSFNAESNRTYTVLYSGALATTNWTVLTNIPAPLVATNVTISDSVGGTNRFYLVSPGP